DPDLNQPLTYSISGGADRSLFTIDPSTGALSFATAPNFEAPADANHDNVYEVTVQVTDQPLGATLGNARFDTQDLAVTVTNVNEAPLITSNGGGDTASMSFSEGYSSWLTTVTATDADIGQTLAYSIAGGADAGLFYLDPTTGGLAFNTPFSIVPSFETPI